MTAQLPHHKGLVGRRAPHLPPGLLGWLRSHPAAWSGWPTNDAHDPVLDRQRARRLEAAGCPSAWAWAIPAVNLAIARLRLERREKLRRQVARISLD